MAEPDAEIAIELRPDQQAKLAEIADRRGLPLIALVAEAITAWSATHERDGVSGLDARFQGRSVDAEALSDLGREAVDWWLTSPHVRDAS
jgi:hypothetical protein